MARNSRNRNKLAVAPLFTAALVIAVAGTSLGQSSSLFLAGERAAVEQQMAASQPAAAGAVSANVGAATPSTTTPNAPLEQSSFIAVAAPEPRTFGVNDLVTIVVVERTQYRADNRLQQDRRWNLEWKLEQWFRFHDHKWKQQDFAGGNPEIDMELNDRRTGNARADRKDELTTRITATIIDVKPNGLLVLEASKRLTYAEETQVSTLLGTCRSSDVTADNTVLSTQLANLEVITSNEGSINDTTRRGWLLKILDAAKPF
jgi:flagellar L-ring protein precursor FlgH